ncbi:MAG: hypothetical protein M3P34_10270, partial [Actinomycetota bacterium]|nr:hypothetical protein [Actinomycetota bacterium]
MPDSESTLEELASFPIAVEVKGRRTATDSGAVTGSDAEAVLDALSETLGWRLRDRDPKGFRAALTQAFELSEVEGHREWRWRPRSVNVQADLGAITGAQASICARAKSSVENVVEILERLTALEPAGDPELMHASRSIVRLKLNELVRELGQESGPRVTRVDSIFDTLVGKRRTVPGGGVEVVGWQNVGGELGRLRRRFGFAEGGVNTVKEETALTDFIVVVDHVSSLAGSWAAVRDHFERATTTSDRYLGTQLVVISRLLSVVAENTDEVSAALDSVLVGEGERESTDVRWPRIPDDLAINGDGEGIEQPSDHVLSLAEGLHWIEDLTRDAAHLVEEAGKEALPGLAS